jgi:hypothetical protein
VSAHHPTRVKRRTASPPGLAVAGIIVVLQVLIIQVGGAVFSTTPLTPGDWARSVLLGASVLPFAALVRLVGQAWSGRGPAAAGAR